MYRAKHFLALIFLVLPLLLSAWANYESISNPYFKIFYRKGWETAALNLLQTMEYHRPYVEKLTGNKLGQIPFVIEDMGNIVNGYTNPVGNKIAVFAYPPSAGELSVGEDWWQLVGVHEYIHMAQITKASGEPAILRSIFGNMLYPNLYQPNWMSEAITVYGESGMNKYSGRMNGGYYPSIITSLAKEGKLPSITKAGYNSSDYTLANHYVFGGSFYKYLADTYGADKFPILYDYTGSTLFSYLNPIYSNLSLNAAYKEAFGKSLIELWNDWQAHEISKPVSLPTQPITTDGWEKSNLTWHDNSLYFTAYRSDKTGPFSSFGSYTLKRMYNPGYGARLETVVSQDTDFPAGFKLQGDNLYYSRQEMRKGFGNNEYNGLGVLTEIWQKHLYSGQSQKLITAPIRSFCISSDGNTLYLSEDNEFHDKSLIYRYDINTKQKTLLFRMELLVNSLHLLEGRLILSAKGFLQNTDIYELSLSDYTLKPLVSTPYAEDVVQVSGSHIIYESVYDTHKGCYSYDLNTGRVSKIGDFDYIGCYCATPDGSNYFLALNGDGVDVYSDPLSSVAFSLPREESKAAYQKLEAGKDLLILDKYPVFRGGYAANIGHMLWPRMLRFPIIEPDEKGELQYLGVVLAGNDILGDFPLWIATLLYDLQEGKFGFEAQLQNDFFRPISQTIGYSSLGKGNISADQSIQLLTRMNRGIKNIWTGLGLTTSDGFERKLWYPYLGTSFGWGNGKASVVNALMYETTKYWPSDRDRLGWQANMAIKQKLTSGMEISSKVAMAFDPDAGTDKVFGNIRGYSKNWEHNKGTTFQNTLNAPIIRVREGIWNPNIFLDDICLGLFFDGAITGDKQPTLDRWATGIELLGEFSLGYMGSLDLGLRVAYNKDGKVTPSLVISNESIDFILGNRKMKHRW